MVGIFRPIQGTSQCLKRKPRTAILPDQRGVNVSQLNQLIMSTPQSYTKVLPGANMSPQSIVTPTESGELVISSLDLASGLEIAHGALIVTIKKHLSSVEEFGRVHFENRPFKTNGGIQQVVIVLLNEGQSLFVGSLSRNTKPVVAFKANLIKEFQRMRQLFSMPVAPPAPPDPSKAICKLQKQVERLTAIHEEYIKPMVVQQKLTDEKWKEQRVIIMKKFHEYVQSIYSSNTYDNALLEVKKMLKKYYNINPDGWYQREGEHFVDAAYRLGHGEKVHNVVMIGLKL